MSYKPAKLALLNAKTAASMLQLAAAAPGPAEFQAALKSAVELIDRAGGIDAAAQMPKKA